ncbi:methyltransferase domain-containing protein [Nocardia brasiliensis]|uniref:Methyltransferase domain-containing protein n=1 Tax=Nocardia brasiliensis TaxID=37326 RepID=A0A6G9XR56_NOCBR|nr:class I SAM-dependent methyltransferase [Nocardia brasiliensis]QIS03404.1 methyltransferase domain-containing protein [Nocardia brasiliensis]
MSDVTQEGCAAHNSHIEHRYCNKRQPDRVDIGLRPKEKLEFEVADAANLPFTDQQFDGAHALESLLHMPYKFLALRKMRRGGTSMRRRAADSAA